MKIDSSLSNEELCSIIASNCYAMQNIINSEEFVINGDKEELEKVFLDTFDACLEAERRGIKIENMNFILAISSLLGYAIEYGKLVKKSEFKNGVFKGYNKKRKK